ncbi:MAG: hypothetical protein ABH868_00110 [bacterium]
MKKNIFLILLVLFVCSSIPAFAFDPETFEMESFDKENRTKDTFIGFCLGIHRFTFPLYNSIIQDYHVRAYNYELDYLNYGYSYRSEDLKGDILAPKLSFGYRKGSHGLVFNAGYLSQVSATWEYYVPSTGEVIYNNNATASATFINLTYRFYFMEPLPGEVDFKPRSIVPYFGVGAGWYFATWRMNDPYDPLVTENGDVVMSPRCKGSSWGFNTVGGIELFVSRRVSFNLELEYLYAVVRGFTFGVYSEETPVDYAVGGFGPIPFEDLQLDLSGPAVSFTTNYHF